MCTVFQSGEVRQHRCVAGKTGRWHLLGHFLEVEWDSPTGTGEQTEWHGGWECEKPTLEVQAGVCPAECPPVVEVFLVYFFMFFLSFGGLGRRGNPTMTCYSGLGLDMVMSKTPPLLPWPFGLHVVCSGIANKR